MQFFPRERSRRSLEAFVCMCVLFVFSSVTPCQREGFLTTVLIPKKPRSGGRPAACCTLTLASCSFKVPSTPKGKEGGERVSSSLPRADL